MTRNRMLAIGAVILGIIVIGAGLVFGIPAYTEAQKRANVSYTYNIQAKIVSIVGVANPNSSTKFKYIVTVEITDPKVVKLSTATHVLPELGVGLHSVPIPDTDMAGYIDWEASRTTVANPIDSAGVKIYTYELHDWVLDKVITLTCHEEIGSSGAAELVCSEF